VKTKTENWLDLADDDFKIAGYVFRKKEYLYTLFLPKNGRN